ncbi:hypothetical protein SDC9_96593 [bioreactor metagenome]|uniref:4Fe-4S ferredoxin-type domain-containing protein n=1 Tax=bioreactor metagenome TaxID=1076179 RepID=A0A645A9K8_9ZZZZ|nr:4Fe-4S binding protein [Candidatus Metalachnospira sp.]
MLKEKHWYDYLWIWSAVYFFLGFFNIIFAWIGLIDFIIPILIAVFGKNKLFCNKYCGRGQLFDVLGRKFKLSRNKPTPKWISSKHFRYGFLIFFMAMFANMIFVTYLTFTDPENLRKVVTLFWTFKLPWNWAYSGGTAEWIAQFAFGFYSLMITSTLIGLITMLLYKPRSWCVYCPMGTMTQTICKVQNGGK